MFKRNFYKSSAVCPKCGSNDPTPKYIPEDRSLADGVKRSYYYDLLMGFDIPRLRDYNFFIILDRVVCLCQCGFTWEQRD